MNYLKTAFTTRWNLLFFGAGVAAAFISGFPAILLPLVAAGEIYYMASMVTNDRFRRAVDAQDAKARRAEDAAGARARYDRIRKQLPPPLLARFDRLKEHCQRLVELGAGLRGADGPEADGGSLESLDRLLWGYLRMIWGAASLSQYLDHSDDGSIRARIADLERRLAKLPAGGASDQLRSTLEDRGERFPGVGHRGVRQHPHSHGCRALFEGREAHVDQALILICTAEVEPSAAFQA